jgi:hypothetical protein
MLRGSIRRMIWLGKLGGYLILFLRKYLTSCKGRDFLEKVKILVIIPGNWFIDDFFSNTVK